MSRDMAHLTGGRFTRHNQAMSTEGKAEQASSFFSLLTKHARRSSG